MRTLYLGSEGQDLSMRTKHSDAPAWRVVAGWNAASLFSFEEGAKERIFVRHSFVGEKCADSRL